MSQSQVPAFVAEYFGSEAVSEQHPTIVQAFKTGSGWKRYPVTKKVSVAWLRKMKREGYTTVALKCGSREADFQIREVLGYAERPLFGGRVI